MADFTHVESWVFDLDNTLYPADCNLFAQIDTRMTQFIESALGVPHSEARRLQKHFYVEYGTTLNGLMREYGVSPDEFLAFVHDIDHSPLAANPVLGQRIGALPGRRFVFTNGSAKHAEDVMERIGIADHFDDIFDIRAADFTPKPHRMTYERFLRTHGIDARAAAMFEDLAHNLEAAHALGMTTVLVSSEADWIADEPADKRPARASDRHPHVHHVTDDLATFLGAIAVAPAPADA